MVAGKKSSFVWKYFTLSGDKRATCNICNSVLAFSTFTMSNLGRHVKRRHPQVLRTSTDEVPMEVYRVQKIEEVAGTEVGGQLNTFEIAMKGFEELEQEANDSEKDPEWTPENAEDWTPKPVAGSSGLCPGSSTGSQVQKKEKKPTRRSAVWDHFEKSADKTSGRCQHCGKLIKLGTISNLFRHLRQKHPNTPVVVKSQTPATVSHSTNYEQGEREMFRNNFEICTEVIEVNIDDIQNPLSIIERKFDEELRNITDEEFDYADVNVANNTQSSQTEFLDDSDEFDMCDFIKPKKIAVVAEQIDRQLVKWLVKGCHSISTLEQPAFKDFVRLLNPKYELPSVNRVAKELIPECYKEYERKASKSLKVANGICLYIDQWKSKSNNYMCVTAHFINTECKFESLFLSCHILSEFESSGDVSERLRDTVNEWEIGEKIVAVVSDNTNIIATALSLCNWTHIPHFVLSLTLIVHECLQTIKALVTKVKTIIGDLVKAPEDIAEIYSIQKAMNLPQVKLLAKVKNEWSSSFATVEMLTRFVKLRTAISQVLKNGSGIKLTDTEWKILKGVVDVLAQFKNIKREMLEGERIGLSKIVFYMRALKKEMKTFCNMNSLPSDVIYAATVAEAALNKQFSELEGLELISNVLLLDPRLKKYVFEDESEFALACSRLKKEVCEVTLPEVQYREPSSQSLWRFFDQEVAKLNAVKDPIGKGILELENYLQEQLLGRDEDPLVWWNHRKAIYPRLFTLAKKYLCVTAKSAMRESISFKSAYMLTNLKYNESSPTESEIMFLHHNM